MNRYVQLQIVVLVLLSFTACGATLGRTSTPGEFEMGKAAYYSDSLHGKKTASGEPYDKNALTAAHKQLPFGTVVKVTNLNNRRSVKVRINDRGPFGDRRRIIDLSRAAAKQLDMISAGVVDVKVEIVESPNGAEDR